MENGVIKRISLSGSIRGSALLREYGGETRVELAVRGLKDGAELYTLAGGRISVVPVSGPALAVRQTGICAAVLAKGGRIIAAGFTKECAADRKRLLDEIRIRSAESADRSKKEAPRPENKPASRPKAFVTGNILERARRLFSLIGDLEAANEKPAPEKPPEPGFETVPNPFPKTFPNSVWQRRDGDARLFGSVTVNGRTRRYVAVPIDTRGGHARVRGAHPIIGRDGRRYLAEALD